jgi:hypothetical protein
LIIIIGVLWNVNFNKRKIEAKGEDANSGPPEL